MGMKIDKIKAGTRTSININTNTRDLLLKFRNRDLQKYDAIIQFLVKSYNQFNNIKNEDDNTKQRK